MNIKIAIKRSLFALPMLLAGLTLGSCADDIEIDGKFDESQYEAATRVDGMIFDANTNKNESVIELRGAEYSTEVVMRLSQMPQKGVDARVVYDAAYLEKYNEAHNTSFELFPEANVAIARNGELLLAPDDKVSASVGIKLTAPENIVEDKTYVVPLAITTSTEGITLPEKMQHAVYLVKDMRAQSDTFKGEGAVTNVLYFEVNDTNPLNALEFVLAESGKLFFDHVVLFAANINYNPETNRVYLYNNENVQYLLDHNEEFLQPLRKRGMKVILSILGNHDCSGVAQLSDMGAKEFAKELAAYVYAYNLDGIAFDDEYSSSPDLSNPWFTNHSNAAAARLCYECKLAMPDKIVSLYYLGAMNSYMPAINGVDPGVFVDYEVADYGGAATPLKGHTLKNCGGMSIELNIGRGNSSTEVARARKQAGYGYYMFFALDPSKYSYQVGRCRSVCLGLYDEDLLEPAYYYSKNDTTRKPR